jgi:hypothetical protein
MRGEREKLARLQMNTEYESLNQRADPCCRNFGGESLRLFPSLDHHVDLHCDVAGEVRRAYRGSGMLAGAPEDI